MSMPNYYRSWYRPYSCRNEIGEIDGQQAVITHVKNTNPKMSLTQKILLLLKREPEKSFIKLGIMDENEIPTDEGITLVVSHLLRDKAFVESFTRDVVDPLLKEREEGNKQKLEPKNCI